ncbi:Retrovirus-related Pol polyprotein from transposon 17.6, partial [Mucuna pruriens]
MQFRLTNAPSTFVALMNDVLRCLIGWYVVVYFDDILVYSMCVNDHVKHVRQVLQLLKNKSLYMNLEKCTFYTQEVIFLGFVVGSTREGMKSMERDIELMETEGGRFASISITPCNTNLGDKEGSQKDMTQTIGYDFQRPLTRVRLKRLEAEVLKNMNLFRGQGASK